MDLSDSPDQDHLRLFRLQGNFLLKEQCRFYTINIPRELEVRLGSRPI
jgi:hypothetical protein